MLAHPSGSASPNLPSEAKLLRRISRLKIPCVPCIPWFYSICCAERSGDFDDGLGDAHPAWSANQDAGISYHAIAVCRLVRFKVGLERLLKGGLLVLELFDFENYFDQSGALFFDLVFCEFHVFVPFGLVVVGWWTGARMHLH